MAVKILIFFIFFALSSQDLSSEKVFENLKGLNTELDEYLPYHFNDSLFFRRTVQKGRNSKFSIFHIAVSDINFISPREIDLHNPIDSSYYIDNYSYQSEEDKSPHQVYHDPSTTTLNKFNKYKLQFLDRPEKMENEISSSSNDFHPTFAPDGSFIVFASDRPGSPWKTENQTDLYISFRKGKNSWTKPKNLGKEINSEENELAPYIAPDGSLYYSSKGFIRDNVQIVFSGREELAVSSDIYIREEKKNYNIVKATADGKASGKWSNPKLLDYPINSEFDEIGATMSQNGIIVASDRPYGRGPKNFDLYGYFEKIDTVIEFEGDYFVTGYYKPSTKKNLDNLVQKIEAGKLKTGPENNYIADPRTELDESGNKIDYYSRAEEIEQKLNSISDFIYTVFKSMKRSKIRIMITGFTDNRKIVNPQAIYSEEDYYNDLTGCDIKSGSPMDNILLSELRACFTADAIFEKLKEKIAPIDIRLMTLLEVSGQGIISEGILHQNRKVQIKLIID